MCVSIVTDIVQERMIIEKSTDVETLSSVYADDVTNGLSKLDASSY